MNAQKLAAERNVSVYCQNHGALPGEWCTPTMRACIRRKRQARADAPDPRGQPGPTVRWTINGQPLGQWGPTT